jgi:uracil-DNA glycosylase
MTWSDWWEGRGEPSEHDPGPPRNRRWARLFAETPNYRALGTEVGGREMFRWHFGPMFYRGRLGDRQVKVMVVGQEGAQDESLSHRAFTGGTGSRLQHLLGQLGISRSYLFLNTFCYPIYGQYGDHLRELAHHPESPIAAHRNRVFDYVVARNDLQLVIAVGRAAKESIATWFAAHGVSVDPDHLVGANAAAISPSLRSVGVLHPGGAVSGGGAAVKADFARAASQVERWREDHPGWLPPDPGAVVHAAADYVYGSAPIPFRDFPFGITWRLGRGGTSSNRQDGQRSIQLFSAGGRYNGRGDDPAYRSGAFGSTEGYRDEPADLPYEPPRRSYLQYDRGPDPGMARLLCALWPRMEGATGHPSLGFGPVYRGLLAGATVLVLADAASHDDLFTGRALTGECGQLLQAWMMAAGISRRYLILRVPPFDRTGASRRQRERWVDDPATVAAYARILERVESRGGRPPVTVTVGPLGKRLAARLDRNIDCTLVAHGATGWANDWKRQLADLRMLPYSRDSLEPEFEWDGSRGQIPRSDLPYGTLRWQGSSGDRAVGGVTGDGRRGDYYKLFLPRWVFDLEPRPLTDRERETIPFA